MAKLRPSVLLTGALGLISGLLLCALLLRQYQFMRLENDIRFANDIGWTGERDKDSACKGDVTNAANLLWKLHFPGLEWPGAPQPFHGPLSQIVERQRKGTVRRVIECLKTKSGENLGDDPEPWILRFGDESVRDQLTEMQKMRTNK